MEAAAVDSKALNSVEIKDAEKGRVTAVFSTFGVIDKDGDVTEKGAIKDGTKVRISAYNHGSWQGALPVGKGVIRVDGKEARLEGEFFMNTTHGRDTFETVKALSEDGQQEWSYGFKVRKDAPGEVEGKRVRVLKELDVYEVSPVMIGAGVGTRTLAIKSEATDQLVELIRKALPYQGDDEDRPRRRRRRRDEEDEDRSSDRESEDEMDEEDEERPRRRRPRKLADEAEEVMASLKDLRERAAEVVAKRAEKGGKLGDESSALLEEIRTELKALEDLLDETPVDTSADDAHREWLRALHNEL
jgi:HK97 family phage prohead protease